MDNSLQRQKKFLILTGTIPSLSAQPPPLCNILHLANCESTQVGTLVCNDPCKLSREMGNPS